MKAFALRLTGAGLVAIVSSGGTVLLVLVASGTTADAQMVSAPGTLCCSTATLGCWLAGAPPADAGTRRDAGAPPAPGINSLGVPLQCPAPADPNEIVIEITIPGAQPIDPSNLEVEIQDAEPKIRGFEGACLAPFISYTPQVPSKCYRVKVKGITADLLSPHPYTIVSAPASLVLQSYSDYLLAAHDSYETLLTCYHKTSGQCPSSSRPVGARSCCDLGTHMTSLDGKVARGFASMPTIP